MPDDPHAATRAEVTAWFFEDYLPRWVAAGAGTSAEGPEFILNYWSTPMHVTGLDQSFWCLDDASLLGLLELNYAPCASRGTAHRGAGPQDLRLQRGRGGDRGHLVAPARR